MEAVLFHTHCPKVVLNIYKFSYTCHAAADATPSATPAQHVGGLFGATPVGGAGLMTPTPNAVAAGEITPEQYMAAKWEREMDDRNRPMSDEELDALLPSEGYKILQPPSTYVPIRTPARKLSATPTPLATPG